MRVHHLIVSSLVFIPAGALADEAALLGYRVEVRLVEEGARTAGAPVALTLSVPRRGCARASSDEGADRYHVRLCHRDDGPGTPAGPPAFSLQLDRQQRARGGALRRQSLAAEVRVAAGKTALFGELVYATGRRLTVTATTR